MAETPSSMLPLGTKAPDFTLPDTISGKSFSLHQLASKTATVIMFICNHCPYVKLIESKLLELAREFSKKGIQFVAISANDAKAYPEDSPDAMKAHALEKNYPFPYLHDESQATAKAYHAACTPDFYVFDKDLQCIYRGRFDEATPGNGKPVTGFDLHSALTAILNNQPINAKQIPSVGCNIKWKNR